MKEKREVVPLIEYYQRMISEDEFLYYINKTPILWRNRIQEKHLAYSTHSIPLFTFTIYKVTCFLLTYACFALSKTCTILFNTSQHPTHYLFILYFLLYIFPPCIYIYINIASVCFVQLCWCEISRWRIYVYDRIITCIWCCWFKLLQKSSLSFMCSIIK